MKLKSVLAFFALFVLGVIVGVVFSVVHGSKSTPQATVASSYVATPCLSKQEFEITRSKLDKEMYGADYIEFLVVSDVTCQDSWAVAETKVEPTDIAGISVMQYTGSKWILIDYRGHNFAACLEGPPKIKEFIGC